MKDISKLKITPKSSIKEAMELLNVTSKQFLAVVDEESKLLGTLTDGDIRRAILKGVSIDSSVSIIMNQSPIVSKVVSNNQYYINILKKANRKQLPIIDENNELKDVFFLDDWGKNKQSDHKVVLMAGGLGTRLRPLTNEIPKPMLKVGESPIIETIIERFRKQGFYNFFIAVNYKKEVIQNYLQDGKAFGVEISYLEENKRLGTAGPLTLIGEDLKEPMIVMNGDILTNLDFNNLLNSHYQSEAVATVAVRNYKHRIPYGVIVSENETLIEIKEKPSYDYLINAGIYILTPEILKYIPKDSFFDMPDLLEELLKLGLKVNIKRIDDYWIDIGQIEDYKKANQEMLGK